jgi:hypothetical protein
MNIFSFVTVAGTYTLKEGWSSVLIVPTGAVQIVNGASPPQSITITSALKLGSGGDIYGDLIINGNASLVINGDAVSGASLSPDTGAIWGNIIGTITNQADLVNYIPSVAWSKSGNALSSRGVFGSIAGAFGWDERLNNVVFGGVNNDTSRFYGTTASFADTNYSFQTLGNTSATYGFQIKNIDNTSLFSVRNDGQSFSRSLVLGNSSVIGAATLDIFGATDDNDSTAFQVRANNYNALFRVRCGGLTQTTRLGINPSNISSSGADPGYTFDIYSLLTNDVTSFAGAFRKGDFSNILEMRSDGNIRIGEQVATYGGGAGVLFISNALTAPTAAPSNGYVDFGFQGTKRAVSSGGFHTMLAGNYTAVSATYTALTTDANIECTANTFAVTLFTAVTVDRTIRTITNTGAGTITVACTGAQTISGAATVTLVQWESLSYYPNGTNFIAI